MLSLLIPIYNEVDSVLDTLERAEKALSSCGEEFEIVAINDGSTDGTLLKLEASTAKNLKIISRAHNRGYGASLSEGIRKSSGDLIAITDADGTYPIEQIPELLRTLRDTEADMVVGARTKQGVQIPLVRRPAKWFIRMLAIILTGRKIPDLNSGLRIFTRDLAESFMHLYPQKFSFTTTITLGALTSGYYVEYVPIDYFKRTGKSTLSAGMNGVKNFAHFISLIIRITTYFRPLRFFAWPSILLILAGLVTIIMTLVRDANVSDAGLLLFVTGVQIGLFGLLAEIVVRQRKA